MARLLALSALSCTLFAAVPALAQPNSSSSQSSVEVSIEETALEFLSRKRANQAIRQARLDNNRRGNALPQLRRLLSESDYLRPVTPGVSQAVQEEIQESLIIDAAQYLAAADFAPNRVAAYLRAGFNPLDAAINIVRGSPSAVDAAVLANRVVVGRVTSVEDTGSEDEPMSIVTFAVSQNLLGPDVDTIRFEQAGSSFSPLRSTLLDTSDDSFLLFLTDPEGNLRGRSRRAASELATNLVTPFKLDGAVYRTISFSTMRPISLSDLTAQIEPLSSLRINN